MGAYCPTPLITNKIKNTIFETVFTPLLEAFKKENISYKGIVYAGLMISKSGKISIVEFNVRFGDPETQVVLPLLETDLLDVFEAISTETLSEIDLKWSDKHSVCVVLASGGYPGNYKKGLEINGLEHKENDISIIHAGTIQSENKVITNGGRVLGVISTKPTLDNAIESAYKYIPNITFNNMYFRKDIGQKAKRYLTSSI